MAQVAFTIAMFVTVGLLVYVAFLAFSSGDDLSLGTHSDQASDEAVEDTAMYSVDREYDASSPHYRSPSDPYGDGSYELF